MLRLQLERRPAVLYNEYGFTAIAFAALLVPLGTLLVVAPLSSVSPIARVRPTFARVLDAVWAPGIGLALSSIGFGAIATFIALLFADRDWGPAWPAFTAVSIAFVVGRLTFGHLPDKIGGAKVAFACVLIEAAGQALIWLASGSEMALVGAALTGFGYSLIFPSFGVEAVRRAPPENRGLAMGAYTAFLDLALGLANPGLGLIAASNGLSSVFLVSTLAVICAAGIALHLRSPSKLTA